MSRLFAAILVLCCCCQFSIGQDWPALRGESGYGSINTENGILRRTSSVQLKTRWKKPLGSAYSSVVISGDRLVTMYSNETDDLVICLNAADGETLWQTETNPIFHNDQEIEVCLSQAVCVAAQSLTDPTPSGGMTTLEECLANGDRFGFSEF